MTSDKRLKRPVIAYSILFLDKPSDCGSCGKLLEPGLVGWYEGKANGPLCLACLLENCPDLGSVLATVQLVREIGATLQTDDSTAGREASHLLARFARHFEAFAANRWPRHPLNFLTALKTALGYYEGQDIHYYEDQDIN